MLSVSRRGRGAERGLFGAQPGTCCRVTLHQIHLGGGPNQGTAILLDVTKLGISHYINKIKFDYILSAIRS